MGLLLLLLTMAAVVDADEGAFIGVNIGTSLFKMPSPVQVVALLKSQQIRHVRLYDADKALLLALANTGISVAITVPNEALMGLSQSNATAGDWITHNVAVYFPATNITTISVGNDVLNVIPSAGTLLPSVLFNLHTALIASNLATQIKISTPLSSSLIINSFPPSQASFNESVAPIVVPILKFLRSTNSFLLLNVYPYYSYMQSNHVIPLDYALFKPLPPEKEAVDSVTLLHYTNVFDALIDSAYFAMASLNFTNIPIIVSETGWPSKGGKEEPEATIENANIYNSNLINHVLRNKGTPKYPGISVSTYVYELYNEDVKSGSVSEKNWGLFFGNGEPVYLLNLMGSGILLANDTKEETYCVAKDGVEEKNLQAGLDWACGFGNVDCTPLMHGKACYDPDTVVAHASYAFNAYYQQMGMAPGSCDFKGSAVISTTNPSHGSCMFIGRNATSINSKSFSPTLNSTSSSQVHFLGDNISRSLSVGIFLLVTTVFL